MAVRTGLDGDYEKRKDLIRQIEEARGSRVITYFLSDRQHASAQIADDAVRPMYEHLLRIGRTPKLDLFVYSNGGGLEVPWRIVTMIREFTPKFAVLIPSRAMSAATLIGLGADELVMGRKAEIGPIDPQVSFKRVGDGGTAVQEQISVEDIMSYVIFLKEKVGLSDQAALAAPITKLAELLHPWNLGQFNRVHSHIRIVARKLLTARNSKTKLKEEMLERIIETLAERTYQHGHSIGRGEAAELGLPVTSPSDDLETALWGLFLEYERLCELQQPIELKTLIPMGESERTAEVTMGCIESLGAAHHYTAELRAKAKRAPIPQLNLNLNLSLQMPPGVDPAQIPPDAQQQLTALLQQVQPTIQKAVQDEVVKQAAVIAIEGGTQDGAWRLVSG